MASSGKPQHPEIYTRKTFRVHAAGQEGSEAVLDVECVFDFSDVELTATELAFLQRSLRIYSESVLASVVLGRKESRRHALGKSAIEGERPLPN